MGKRIIIVGAGGVGGYIGGHLAKNGEDVILIDPWPEHIDYIKKNGIQFSDPKSEYTIPVQAMHLHEVQSLFKRPVDMAFIATKAYDTEWATAMIKQYLAPDGFVVSMQNSINEERIAGIVGWGKTVGCIVTGISVNAHKAGHIMRAVLPGDKPSIVFRVGEVHGRITQRANDLAKMLNVVDCATVTTNIWGERWSKLVVNSMYNAVSAATGLNSRKVVEQKEPRRLGIKLSSEAVQVGRALGYELETIRGMEIEKILATAEGDTEALAEIENILIEWAKSRTEAGRPSTGQDIVKGRRTEIDFLNGLVVEKGKEVGLSTPANEAITAVVKRIELGELEADPKNIAGILND